MANFDLETLATEYRNAAYELKQQEKIVARCRVVEFQTRNALVEAIIESGQIEYGPITSDLVWQEGWQEGTGEYRRVWRMK